MGLLHFDALGGRSSVQAHRLLVHRGSRIVCASIGRLVYTRRAVHRQQGITWSITARVHRHTAHDTAQLSFRALEHVPKKVGA
jgi:hypothetical protein